MQIGFLVCAANVFVWWVAQQGFLGFAPQAGPRTCFCYWSGSYAEALTLVSDTGTSFRVDGCESVQWMEKRFVCCVGLVWQLLAQVRWVLVKMLISSTQPVPA